MGWMHSFGCIRYRGGKVKVVCACGKQSSKLPSVESAREWYAAHTGIVEKPRR